jgi:hypothetical protein
MSFIPDRYSRIDAEIGREHEQEIEAKAARHREQGTGDNDTEHGPGLFGRALAGIRAVLRPRTTR